MKYSILFMPDNRAHLRMVVRYMGKRLFCNVGYNIDTDKWNKDTQRCRRNTTHGKDLVPAAKSTPPYSTTKTPLCACLTHSPQPSTTSSNKCSKPLADTTNKITSHTKIFSVSTNNTSAVSPTAAAGAKALCKNTTLNKGMAELSSRHDVNSNQRRHTRTIPTIPNKPQPPKRDRTQKALHVQVVLPLARVKRTSHRPLILCLPPTSQKVVALRGIPHMDRTHGRIQSPIHHRRATPCPRA